MGGEGDFCIAMLQADEVAIVDVSFEGWEVVGFGIFGAIDIVLGLTFFCGEV